MGGGGVISLFHGDCFAGLEKLKDGSVDVVITDPPYATTECEWDRPIDLKRWWEVISRKLKPRGVAVVFASGRFVFELYASNPKQFRYELCWEKSRAVGFLDVKHRPMRAHEWMLVFADRLKGSTYNPQKVACPTAKIGASHKSTARTSIYDTHDRPTTWTDDGTRHPRSVLRVDSISRGDDEHTGHPTQKPRDLMTWLVKTYSNPGDLVVDPFVGSGSTAEACLLTGRRFFGCERDRGYFETAKARLTEADLRGRDSGRVTGRTSSEK